MSAAPGSRGPADPVVPVGLAPAEGVRLLGHRLQGSGDETVLLLNGGMMTHGSWEPLVSDLVASYRVLGCDFRGQLQSPGEGHHRLEDNVGDLVALLDVLGLDSVHVLGTSFGGEVAILLASLQPSRVRSLAVVTAVDRTPPGMAEDSRQLRELAREAAAGGDATAFRDRLESRVYSEDYLRDHADLVAARRRVELPRVWYQGLLGILASIQDFDLTPHLARIRCPTLVVHAGRDLVMPEERVRAVAEGIDGADLRIHPTSGHALVVEDQDWLVHVYRDFLAGLPSPSRRGDAGNRREASQS